MQARASVSSCLTFRSLSRDGVPESPGSGLSGAAWGGGSSSAGQETWAVSPHSGCPQVPAILLCPPDTHIAPSEGRDAFTAHFLSWS